MDDSRRFFPDSPAIYFVYRASFNAVERLCTVKQLLYIGETDNLKLSLTEDMPRQSFIDKLLDGENLFYTFAISEYNKDERQKIVQALIFETRPTLNNKIERPPYKTRIIIEGNEHAFIPASIESPSF